METAKELQKGEVFATQHDTYYDLAREECLTKAAEILMNIEHLVDDMDTKVDVNDTVLVGNAILEVLNLRFYDYVVWVEGKYRDGEQTFEYDFSDMLDDLLEDTLGFMKEGK